MRLLVLVLSLGCVVAYGRALGELGGYFLGKGSLTVVGGGLLGGPLAGVGAVGLWRRYLVPRDSSDRKSPPKGDPHL